MLHRLPPSLAAGLKSARHLHKSVEAGLRMFAATVMSEAALSDYVAWHVRHTSRSLAIFVEHQETHDY